MLASREKRRSASERVYGILSPLRENHNTDNRLSFPSIGTIVIEFPLPDASDLPWTIWTARRGIGDGRRAVHVSRSRLWQGSPWPPTTYTSISCTSVYISQTPLVVVCILRQNSEPVVRQNCTVANERHQLLRWQLLPRFIRLFFSTPIVHSRSRSAHTLE